MRGNSSGRKPQAAGTVLQTCPDIHANKCWARAFIEKMPHSSCMHGREKQTIRTSGRGKIGVFHRVMRISSNMSRSQYYKGFGDFFTSKPSNRRQKTNPNAQIYFSLEYFGCADQCILCEREGGRGKERERAILGNGTRSLRLPRKASKGQWENARRRVCVRLDRITPQHSLPRVGCTSEYDSL